MIALSLLSLRGSALRRTLPGRRYASWGRPMRRDRMVWRARRSRGTASILMLPEDRSSMRNRVSTRDDLPLHVVLAKAEAYAVIRTNLPVRPTIATFSPASIVREKFSMTGS